MGVPIGAAPSTKASGAAPSLVVPSLHQSQASLDHDSPSSRLTQGSPDKRVSLSGRVAPASPSSMSTVSLARAVNSMGTKRSSGAGPPTSTSTNPSGNGSGASSSVTASVAGLSGLGGALGGGGGNVVKGRVFHRKSSSTNSGAPTLHALLSVRQISQSSGSSPPAGDPGQTPTVGGDVGADGSGGAGGKPPPSAHFSLSAAEIQELQLAARAHEALVQPWVTAGATGLDGVGELAL